MVVRPMDRVSNGHFKFYRLPVVGVEISFDRPKFVKGAGMIGGKMYLHRSSTLDRGDKQSNEWADEYMAKVESRIQEEEQLQNAKPLVIDAQQAKDLARQSEVERCRREWDDLESEYRSKVADLHRYFNTPNHEGEYPATPLPGMATEQELEVPLLEFAYSNVGKDLGIPSFDQFWAEHCAATEQWEKMNSRLMHLYTLDNTPLGFDGEGSMHEFPDYSNEIGKLEEQMAEFEKQHPNANPKTMLTTMWNNLLQEEERLKTAQENTSNLHPERQDYESDSIYDLQMELSKEMDEFALAHYRDALCIDTLNNRYLDVINRPKAKTKIGMEL